MCLAGSAALLADCERLLPDVMRAAHGPAANAEEVSDESLPWHVASSMLHVLAEAAGTYDRTPGGRGQLQGVADLLRLPILQQSLGCGATEKARQLGRPRLPVNAKHLASGRPCFPGLSAVCCLWCCSATSLAATKCIAQSTCSLSKLLLTGHMPADAAAVQQQCSGLSLCAHGGHGCDR